MRRLLRLALLLWLARYLAGELASRLGNRPREPAA